MVPFLDLHAQYETIRAEIDAAVARVIRDSAFIQGPELLAFERDFSRWSGRQETVGVHAGTTALQFALLAAGVGLGDEVITVPNSFIATAEAISHVGATPIFVDVDPQTLLLDPMQLEAARTSRTKAVIPVHLFGTPVPMEPVLAFAEKHRLVVIEDAAQAHGATWKGKRVGSFGRFACYSFYPGKNLGTFGEGGAITMDDAERAAWLRKLRNHGSSDKYQHDMIGWNARMGGLQAAVLAAKLPHLDGWNVKRREHAAAYREALGNLPLAFVDVPPGAESVHHIFAVRTPRRDALQRFLAERGIATGVHYPVPIHLQKAYAHLGKGPGSFPVAERAAQELLSLPMFPELTAAQREEVVAAIRAFFTAAES